MTGDLKHRQGSPLFFNEKEPAKDETVEKSAMAEIASVEGVVVDIPFVIAVETSIVRKDVDYEAQARNRSNFVKEKGKR